MKKKSIGYFIIASAIIWGAVIIAAAIILRDSPVKHSMNMLLSAGAGLHLLFIWGPMGAMFKKMKDRIREEN